MRFIIGLCAFSLAATASLPAAADCAAEIKSLFNKGAWDPFTREKRRETTVMRQKDGTETPSSDVLWDGPFKSINCTPNGCYMAIGNEAWQGPSFDGPWKKSGTTGTVEPEVFVRGTNDRLAASVSDAECLGETELDGISALQYRFFSKPEPNEYGSWWGGRYTVWVDPKAKRMLRIELAEGIASWAEKPSESLQITTIDYDNPVTIEEPM